MSVVCDCPICPLTDANVQCCDLIVKLGLHNATFKNLNPDYISLSKNFAMLALMARNGGDFPKLKIGESKTQSCDDYTLSIQRKSVDKFKLCFHTKRVTESDTD